MFKVATFNMLQYQSRAEQRLPLIVAGLIQEWPDLIALQEVSAEHATGIWLQQILNAVVARSGCGAEYRYVQQRNRRNAELSVGILARLPVHDQAWVDLQGQGRVALGITTEVAGIRFGFVSTHLFWEPDPAGEQARLYQAGLLCDWVAQTFPNTFAIIGGDFNTTPGSPTYTFLTERWASLFAEHRGAEPEWTAPTPLVPSPEGWRGTLDYLFKAPRTAPVRVVDARLFLHEPAPTDPSLYPSDHVGVLAALELTR
ncbi:MAG TPA: endonuclease/exonuclease/phosphatase family protein [Chloroflexota bacterium]|nr:endonuclease/exonuclease/phosphatase family protein [Chloroflexota bacterium]